MQVVNYKSGDSSFDKKLGTLKGRLDKRIQAAQKVTNVLQTPFIRQKEAFSELLAGTGNPVDFKYLRFAFKNKKDESEFYPLRYICGVTAGQQTFFVGSDTKSKNISDQQELDLTKISLISRITTFYIRPKQLNAEVSPNLQRRVVAFFIEYVGTDQQPHGKGFSSPSSGFVNTAENPASREKWIEYYDRKSRSSSEFVLDYDQTAPNLNFYPNPSVHTQCININDIAFDEVEGSSKQYIANFAFITSLPFSSEDSAIPSSVNQMNFFIPFQKNSVKQPIELKHTQTGDESVRFVTTTQRSSNFTISIPSLDFGSSVKIGQIASYSSGSSTGTESERGGAEKRSNEFTFTIPEAAYVIDDVLVSPSFITTSQISLLDGFGKEVAQVGVPTSVPFFDVPDEDALTDAILDAI